MAELRFGPFTRGLNMLSDDDALSAGELRQALNFDFSSDGRARRRPGLQQKIVTTGMHSLWSSGRDGQQPFVMVGDTMHRVTADITLQSVIQMPTADPVSYHEHEGVTYAGSEHALIRIDHDGARPIGVPRPAGVTATATPSLGGMTEGLYSVCIQFRLPSGEEGAASRMAQILVPDGGGLILTWPVPPDLDPAATALVFCTTQNGNIPYLAATAPAIMGQSGFQLGAHAPGRPCVGRNLERMRGGAYIQAWNGRLLVARGRSVYVSEPMWHGVYSPRHGFLQFQEPVTMLAALDDGFYVGQPSGVLWVDGRKPQDLQVLRTGGRPPVPGAFACPVDPKIIDPGLEVNQPCAVWLAENGYVVGVGGRSLIEPQASRISLPSSGRGAMAVADRRFITVIRS